MAPVIDTYPSILAPTHTMSAATTSSDAFVALTLGRSANAIDLLVPSAPPVHAAPDLKARCFDFLSDLLVEHSLLFSSAELIAAFSHIPSSSYNATLEASGCCRSIRSAFFLVDNLVAIGFRDHTGAPIASSITADASSRPTGISYFAFRSTVDPSIIDARISLAPFSFEFWLALPQTVFVSPSHATDSAARRLSFTSPPLVSTPRQAPAPVTTAEDLHFLDSTEFAALGHPTGTDLLSDYDHACLPLFSKDQLQHLILRSATAAPTAPVLSPRMTAVLTSTSSSSSSYFGPLDFLDNQVAFDSVFPTPTPLTVTVSTTGASIDSLVLPALLDTFIDRCKFHLFVPIFRSDYVGTFARDDAASLQATVSAIKKLAMSSRNPSSGAWVNLHPDEVFAAYSNLIPLLPFQVSVWGLNLVTQYFDSLSVELQDALHVDPLYSAPDLATLVTRSAQLAALRVLRVAAVRQYTLLRNQEKLIAKTVNRKLKQSHSATALAAPVSVHLPQPPLSASLSPASSAPCHDASISAQTFMSPAEETMRRYQATPPAEPASFPVDPATNFRSAYPLGFAGCMYCGDSNHVFRQCPSNGAPGASAIFYSNLFAHKPHLRKRAPLPHEILPSSTPGIPPTQSFVSGPSTVPTTDLATLPPAPPPLAPLPPSALKKARFCLLHVKSFQANLPAPAPVLPPMPIAIDNGLPHIAFDLGASSSLVELCGLMDTCGALNTGYLLFHLWLKSERPDLVAEFISFDDANPFEPIKLGGAIRDPSDFVSSDHGNLTAVIRYYTPYVDTFGSAITLSFALGSDVTVNTIFGLPMLCDLDSIISLRSNTMHSRILHRDFPITRAAASFGLPRDCTFDPADASRNHEASLCTPPPSSATSILALAPPAPVLATATDDTSLGFLQRTVHPTS
jgi:hypothetical protein